MKQHTLNFVAKLVSDKLGITVIFKPDLDAPCANIEQGIIYVQQKRDYDDKDIATIIHEAGHLRFTDKYSYTFKEKLKQLDTLYSNASKLIGSIINSYEDVRMEALVYKQFIGAKSFIQENTAHIWKEMYDYIIQHGAYNEAWQNFDRNLVWGLYNDTNIIDQVEYNHVFNTLKQSPDKEFIAKKDFMIKQKNMKSIAKWVLDNINKIEHLLIKKTDNEKAMDKLKQELQKMINNMGDSLENEFKPIQDKNIDNLDKTIQLDAVSNKAGGLIAREKINENWVSVQELQSFVNSNLHKLTKSLSILKDVSTTRSITNLRRGRLDTNKLYKMDYSNRLFKKTIEQQKDYKNTVVYILCDESGSMQGDPSVLTSKATALFMKGLDKVGIKSALFGFNCYFNTHKKVDETFNLKQCQDIDKHTNIDKYGGTENGYFLHKVYEELRKRPEHNKILVSFTDGDSSDSNDIYPIDNINYSNFPLKNIAQKIENDKSVKLLSFGVRTNSVQHIYKDYKILNSAEQLIPELISLFKQLMPKTR